MLGSLPALVDPILLAERGERLTGTLPLKLMPRLMQACVDNEAEVQVDLGFMRGLGSDLCEMQGRLTTQIHVTCQRCLEPMELELEVRPELVFARPGERHEPLSEEAAEIIEVDKPISLAEIVEDELLLALPMVPLHALEHCPAREYAATWRGKTNPFAVLKGRKPL
jgi:uncharacterized protein